MHSVNLQNLLTDYENSLCDKTFKYELANNQIVCVSFYREQLCHLLGLQYVYDHDRHYLGIEGFKKIQDGSLTSNKLKSHNIGQYNYIKERLNNFYKIKQLMDEGQFIKFYRDRTHPSSRIEADFIIFQKETAHILHLFLRKEQADKNIYAPVSFVIKSLKDETAQQYLQHQEYKQIVRRSVIEK